MSILKTIIPIFLLIILGWAARKKGFMPPEFLGPANRLVYNLAIPSMVFRSIAGTDFHSRYNFYVLLSTLSAILAVFLIAWGAGIVFRIDRSRLGSFVQSSFHGNLGYIAFAVAYYYLGSEGLVRASIIAGFVIILQNFLAVTALQVNSERRSLTGNINRIIISVFLNPIIISAMAGILFSLISIPIPFIIDRSLSILSSMALPLALLIIGASLSFELMRPMISSIFSVAMIKLLLLPLIGFTMYNIFSLTPEDYLPGLIILASPTATVTFVMAKEMKGDTDFAMAAISASTVLSSVSISAWLNIAGQ